MSDDWGGCCVASSTDLQAIPLQMVCEAEADGGRRRRGSADATLAAGGGVDTADTTGGAASPSGAGRAAWGTGRRRSCVNFRL